MLFDGVVSAPLAKVRAAARIWIRGGRVNAGSLSSSLRCEKSLSVTVNQALHPGAHAHPASVREAHRLI